MNLNDLELNEHCLKVRQTAEWLPYLIREGKWDMLWVALQDISMKANLGQYRVDDLKRKELADKCGQKTV